MARLLGCPHCHARFTLAEWARTAGCPTCGLRVSFFEASEAGGPAEQGSPPAVSSGGAVSGPAVTAAADVTAPTVTTAPIVTAAPPPSHGRTLMGKPLKWQRGMSVVVAIWVLVAVLLILMRTQMGYLTDYTAGEQAARDAVPTALMPDGETTYGEAMAAATDRLGLVHSLEASEWRVWARPWEGRTYVWLEYSDERGYLVLGWWLEDGVVTADPNTERFFASVLDDNVQIDYPGPPQFLQDSLGAVAGCGRGETAPQGVLGDDTRIDELQQVIGSAGL